MLSSREDPERRSRRSSGVRARPPLVESLLFQSGQANRLGTVEAAATVMDWDEEEHKRKMSLAASARAPRVAGAQESNSSTRRVTRASSRYRGCVRVVEGAIVVASGVMAWR